MVYKFGNLELLTEHIFAIGEPEFDFANNRNGGYGSLIVSIYNINGLFVRSKFFINEEIEMLVKPNPDNPTKSVAHSLNVIGLVLTNKEIEWSQGAFYGEGFSKFKESLFYNRIINEIEKLKEAIESK